MSSQPKMKRVGPWVYACGHMFNTATKQLVEVGDIDNKLISKHYVVSDEFRRLVDAQPRVEYPKAEVHEILALELTNRCNYACPYCFEGNSRLNKNVLDFKMACAAIDPLPVGSELRFFGGEPLLQFGLMQQLVARYPQHKYSIVTNGSLITSEVAEFFAEHNFSVGLSYDGSRWQEHNRPAPDSNSQKDFERAMNALSTAGAYVGISTVVTKESIPHLYDIHLEMFDDYPIGGWAYLIAYTPEMTLSDLDVFRDNLLRIIDDFPAVHLLRINDLKKWAMKITGEWPIPTYCGAGACYSALSSRGEKRFCTFFLRESSCYGPSIGAVEVDCKHCSVWNYCHGGCLALNLYGSGATHKSHPFSCKKSHIYFEAGLKTRIKVKRELEQCG